MTDLIQITDASEKFNVHPNTIRRWIRLGAVAATKNEKGFWLVSKAEIKKLLSARSARLANIKRKNT